MSDNEPARCGIAPCTFGGWMMPACEWHDKAYTTGSWQMQHLSREYVDRVFYNQLLELAKRGRCQAGKRAQAWLCYQVVRSCGGPFWEGRQYGDPQLEEVQMVASWIDLQEEFCTTTAFRGIKA